MKKPNQSDNVNSSEIMENIINLAFNTKDNQFIKFIKSYAQ
jgi:hypothetical protein